MPVSICKGWKRPSLESEVLSPFWDFRSPGTELPMQVSVPALIQANNGNLGAGMGNLWVLPNP